MDMYAKVLKRILDFLLSLAAVILLSPVYLILTVTGAAAMKGNPFFTQARPGRHEKIFRLIKFRSMTNEKGSDGKLLPDAQRLKPYGRFLRASSLDELPELFNILKGDMAIVGPRPLLVRDMVFMTSEQRRRHAVRQGLTGLAQVNGRNAMTWEQKLDYDLQYVRDISFRRDLQIVLKTVMKVLQRDGITEEGQATAMDFGDSLLHDGKISREYYQRKQAEASQLIVAAPSRSSLA